jgi:hypothetical protein
MTDELERNSEETGFQKPRQGAAEVPKPRTGFQSEVFECKLEFFAKAEYHLASTFLVSNLGSWIGYLEYIFFIALLSPSRQLLG